MFRQYAKAFGATPEAMFDLHPVELWRVIEDAWLERVRRQVPVGDARFEPRLAQASLDALTWPDGRRGELAANPAPPWRAANSDISWPHAIYGYLIETTNVFEIFRRVLHEFSTGERLGTPSPRGRRWLRSTEQLFFGSPQPYTLAALTSEIRPDGRATRRNLWWRLFGADLQHQSSDGRPYPYEKPDAANREFIPVFEDFLREVWRGIENSGNTSGANPTDNNVIVTLAQSMAKMLSSRRINGNLLWEEYVAVSVMSWFHLTIEFDSPIVVDLNCTATSSAERLRLIGERVGVGAYARSDSCIELADPMSRILLQVEEGDFSTDEGAQSLYAPEDNNGNPNELRATMTTIITQWSAASGRPMKAPKVEVIGSQAGMRTVAQAPTPAQAPTNGNRRVGIG
jgi:hypothetical protein